MVILDSLKNKSIGSGFDIVDNMYYRYSIISYDKPIVFIFPPLGADSDDVNKDTKVWGFDFISSFDVNVVSFGFSGGNDNYFKSDDFIDFMELIAPFFKLFPERLGYGFSKGGFGIGAYANLLSLDKILMVHPVSTKDVNKVPWDTRKTTELAKSQNWSSKYSDISIPESCKVWIFYDPLVQIDKKHVERYELPFLFKKKIFGMGHGKGIGFLVQNSNQWKHIVSDVIHKGVINDYVFFKFKRYIRLSPFYYDSMVKRTRGHRRVIFKKAHEKVRKISKLHNESNESNESIVNNLRDLAVSAHNNKDIELAVCLMRMAHERRPSGPFIKQKLSEYEKELSEQSKVN